MNLVETVIYCGPGGLAAWAHPCLACMGLTFLVEGLFWYGWSLPFPLVCAGHSPQKECVAVSWWPEPLPDTEQDLVLSCGCYSQKGAVFFSCWTRRARGYAQMRGVKQAGRGAPLGRQGARLRDEDGVLRWEMMGRPAGRQGTCWEMMGRPLGDGVPVGDDGAPAGKQGARCSSTSALPTGCTLWCHLSSVARVTQVQCRWHCPQPHISHGYDTSSLRPLRRGSSVQLAMSLHWIR